MADDDSSSDSGSDVIQSDLGNFLNAADRIHTTVTLSIWTFCKSVITFVMAIVMIVITSVLHIIPQIFALIGHSIDLVTSMTAPNQPGTVNQADFLNIANTFFPVAEIFGFLVSYYALYFTCLIVTATMAVVNLGWKLGITLVRSMNPL